MEGLRFLVGLRFATKGHCPAGRMSDDDNDYRVVPAVVVVVSDTPVPVGGHPSVVCEFQTPPSSFVGVSLAVPVHLNFSH
jgi:hypothetical protein